MANLDWGVSGQARLQSETLSQKEKLKIKQLIQRAEPLYKAIYNEEGRHGNHCSMETRLSMR